MTRFNSINYHRQSIRLKDYDYSRDGKYFITLCAYERQCLFGEICNGKMVLNDAGKIVEREWNRSSMIRDEIYLDEWVIMPNHFHSIVIIKYHCISSEYKNLQYFPGPRPKSLSSLIAGFKSSVTSNANKLYNTTGQKIWQSNYYERIIRNANEYHSIQKYIKNNPLKWHDDMFNPNL